MGLKVFTALRIICATVLVALGGIALGSLIGTFVQHGRFDILGADATGVVVLFGMVPSVSMLSSGVVMCFGGCRRGFAIASLCLLMPAVLVMALGVFILVASGQLLNVLMLGPLVVAAGVAMAVATIVRSMTEHDGVGKE